MYPVSSAYKEKIQELNRTFELDIKIYHSNGVLKLSDKDIVQGSLIHSESSQYGEDFTIGGVVASDISMEILRKPEHEDVDFMGARLEIIIGLYVKGEIEAHFLQPSQPSKMPNTNADIERVSLGKFNIDVANKKPNTIVIKAIDNMINLDKPYTLSKLSYPATLYQIYTNICNVADVQIGTFNFPNMDYVVSKKPIGDYTLRNILGYVAELSGGFARFNRYGDLEISWYTPTDTVIHPKNRFDLESSDDLIQITGVTYEVDDAVYLTGTDSYAIDISENPLLQDNYDIVLPNILSAIDKVILKPYTSNWQGNPAIQAGDIISHIDRNGFEYNTVVTHSTYKYRGKSVLKGSGLHASNKGFKGSTDTRINKIIKQMDKVVGDKLTSLEQSQLNATEMIANMLGGHIIEDKVNGIVYIADNPNIDLAMKVWKYGINGFGYSSTGVNGTYTTAVTADGSIVAMLVSANIITANMVQTGLLESEDGSTWINLDNGSFNFKDRLSFIGSEFRLNISPDELNGIDILEEGKLYNNVRISNAKGFEVLDSQNRQRVQLGNYATGKYGLLLKDSSGTKTILDENGILQSWQEGRTDNINTGKPLKLSIFIPSNTRSINKSILRFKREYFRAYSTSTKSGGGDTVTSNSGGAGVGTSDTDGAYGDTTTSKSSEILTTEDSGVDVQQGWENTQSASGHTHQYWHVTGHKHRITIPQHNHSFYIPSHWHYVDIPNHRHDISIPNHSHGIEYGIFESTIATNINIIINGINRTSVLGGSIGFNSDQSNLDITNYLSLGQWNTIDISGTGLGRIDATIFIQALMGIE